MLFVSRQVIRKARDGRGKVLRKKYYRPEGVWRFFLQTCLDLALRTAFLTFARRNRTATPGCFFEKNGKQRKPARAFTTDDLAQPVTGTVYWTGKAKCGCTMPLQDSGVGAPVILVFEDLGATSENRCGDLLNRGWSKKRGDGENFVRAATGRGNGDQRAITAD